MLDDVFQSAGVEEILLFSQMAQVVLAPMRLRQLCRDRISPCW